jgi:hypothetical protein
MRRLTLLLLLALSACATVRSRADDAFTRGDYLAAAQLYDEVVQEHPRDEEARGRLAVARARALDAMLADAEARIRAKDVDGALDATATLLTTRAQWDLPSSDRIAAVAAWARGAIRDEVVRARDRAGVFAAERRMRARGALLKTRELAEAASEVTGIVADAGGKNCAALKTHLAPPTPYLTELVAAYCRHFGAPEPAAMPLPDLVASFEIGGAVEGLSPGQRERLAAAANRWLADSVWYAAEPPRVGHLQLSGTIRSTFGAAEVTRSVPWVEQVPYVTQESYQEPYQESYLDTEYYTESEPYSDTESYPATCGFGSSSYSCSQTRTVTKYRTVQKSRLVTKYRTRYRTAWRTVTRYRSEPRVFTYEAIERTGAHRSDWNAAFSFGDAVPFTVHRANAAQERGDDHDAEFPAAGVEPARADLLSHDDWVAQQIADLGRGFAEAADTQWFSLYCGRATFGDEDAARCVYLRQPTYPQAARTQLGRMFGPELDPLLAQEP